MSRGINIGTEIENGKMKKSRERNFNTLFVEKVRYR